MAVSISVCWAVLVGALCGLPTVGSEEGGEEKVVCTGHLIQWSLIGGANQLIGFLAESLSTSAQDTVKEWGLTGELTI